MYKAKPKTRPQFDIVERDQIPFAVIIGTSELQEGKVRIKQQLGKDGSSEEADKDGQLVDRDAMIQFIKDRMAQRS